MQLRNNVHENNANHLSSPAQHLAFSFPGVYGSVNSGVIATIIRNRHTHRRWLIRKRRERLGW